MSASVAWWRNENFQFQESITAITSIYPSTEHSNIIATNYSLIGNWYYWPMIDCVRGYIYQLSFTLDNLSYVHWTAQEEDYANRIKIRYLEDIINHLPCYAFFEKMRFIIISLIFQQLEKYDLICLIDVSKIGYDKKLFGFTYNSKFPQNTLMKQWYWPYQIHKTTGEKGSVMFTIMSKFLALNKNPNYRSFVWNMLFSFYFAFAVQLWVHYRVLCAVKTSNAA